VNRLAVLILSIPDRERLVPVAEGLKSVKGVIAWQAVDGNANLVTLVEGSADPLLDYLHSTAGAVSMTMCEASTDPNGEQPLTFSSDLTQAWVFADVEEARKAEIQRRLRSIPEVSVMWAARGGCDLIALVSGKTLDEVDRVISQQIQPLDGVLRLKRNRIINLNSL
jgi:DNA-binding Lrp family transcriptional regulator